MRSTSEPMMPRARPERESSVICTEGSARRGSGVMAWDPSRYPVRLEARASKAAQLPAGHVATYRACFRRPWRDAAHASTRSQGGQRVGAMGEMRMGGKPKVAVFGSGTLAPGTAGFDLGVRLGAAL